MLENNPILKDRLQALGVFSGIAIAAVSGFELVIGGGLDFITPGQEIRQVAPSSYVQVMDGTWWADANVVPLSSNEPMFAGDSYAPVTEEELAGGYDDRAAPDGGYPEERTFEDIEADIAALYAETETADYTEASLDAEFDGLAPAYPDEYADEPAASEETIDPKQQDLELEELTAYESGLPS